MKTLTILVTISVLLLAAVVWAKSSYKNAFNTLYGTAGGKLDMCWTCHVDGQPYSVFNSYGADVRTEFQKSGNITTALQAVEEIDSDGDGDTNIVEITAGTHPGDATNSTPVEASTWGGIKYLYQ